jgi:hypothetical protein
MRKPFSAKICQGMPTICEGCDIDLFRAYGGALGVGGALSVQDLQPMFSPARTESGPPLEADIRTRRGCPRLGRRPTPIGRAGTEVDTYIFRPESANNAIKLAGQEIGVFVEKSEVSHRYAELEKLSDEELLLRMRDEADRLLLEHQVRPKDG